MGKEAWVGSIWDGTPDLGSLVAIKLLREGFDNPELRERFTREARSARGLRHGNIVTIFEAGTHQGQPFIVMEFIQGETLAHLIHSRAPLPLERKLQLVDELAAGLEHAHRKGVVHRDIKPANLMIDEDGVLRILDFGIARHGTTGAITQAGQVIGTYNYMAPEQLAGEVVDGRADLFAAGAVFYELLSYRRAFPGEPPAILRRIFIDNPEPLEQVCAGLSPEIIAIVNRCLAKQPNERYVDFAAFRAALSVARHQLTVQDTSDGGVGLDELRRIRSEQIQQHLGTARQAYDTANHSVALQACQRVLMLDPEHAEARDINERARTAVERRKLIRQCLQEAAAELDRGGVSAASALADRALALDPNSEDALALRHKVDEALRRRTQEEHRRRVADALESGRAALAKASLESAKASIDQALRLDADNVEAHALRSEIASAFEARRVADRERAGARARIDEALRRVAEGDFRTAHDLLDGLPATIILPQPLVELRTALSHIDQQGGDTPVRVPEIQRPDPGPEADDAETRLVGSEELDGALKTVRALLADPPAPVPQPEPRVVVAPPPRLPDPVPDETPRPWGEFMQTPLAKAALGAGVALVLLLGVWTAIGSRGAQQTVVDAPATPAAATPAVPPVAESPQVAPPEASRPSSPPEPPVAMAPGSPAPNAGSQLAELQASARTQWQRGETEAALATLAAALKMQPRDSQTRALADFFVRQAEAQAVTAGGLASDAGAGQTARFSSANARASEAARLAHSGQAAAAARVYVETAKLYGEAAADARNKAPAPVPATPRPTPADPPPAAPAVTNVTLRSPYPVLITAGDRSYPAATSHELTLQPGAQTLELTAPQVFLRRTLNIEGRPGATHSEVLPAAVNVRVAAIPANARLTINGWYFGTLPATIPMALGAATLEFNWPVTGKQQRQTVIIVSDGQQVFGQTPQ